jgi:acyl dehydratase
MRLLQRTLAERALTFEAAGAEEIIWLKPVRPGDALTATLVWGLRSCDACGERMGSFPVSVETVNQSGDAVMRWRMDCLLQGPGERDGERSRPMDCPMRKARPARAMRKEGYCGIKFFEDVDAGDQIDLGDYLFTASAIRDFRASYDGTPQNPLDHGRSGFTASGWHVTAAWMHCIVRTYERHANALRARQQPVPVLGPAAGVKHLRWHRPVHANETISYRAWAERKIEIASHKDWGLLVVGAEGVNQRGETVVSFYPQMLLERTGRHRHYSTAT